MLHIGVVHLQWLIIYSRQEKRANEQLHNEGGDDMQVRVRQINNREWVNDGVIKDEALVLDSLEQRRISVLGDRRTRRTWQPPDCIPLAQTRPACSKVVLACTNTNPERLGPHPSLSRAARREARILTERDRSGHGREPAAAPRLPTPRERAVARWNALVHPHPQVMDEECENRVRTTGGAEYEPSVSISFLCRASK